MNTGSVAPQDNGTAHHAVEFFRLPAPGKRGPYFGLSRGWYYKAAARGEIQVVAVRQRGALRGVRLVVYSSIADNIRRSMDRTVSEMVAPMNRTASVVQPAPLTETVKDGVRRIEDVANGRVAGLTEEEYRAATMERAQNEVAAHGGR